MIAVVWAVWAASLFAMAFFGQTAALRWLIAVLPFCFIMSAAATFIAAKSLSLGVVIKESGTKHQGAKGELTLSNKSLLPIVQVRCVMQIENVLTREHYEQTLAFSVIPMDRRKLGITIDSRHCGHLRIVFKRVSALDYFGIARFKIKFSNRYDTIVMPDTFPVQVIPSSESLCPEESEEYEPDRPGYDVSEVHQIRSYVPGDSVRQIHWKLTSKFDQLMVKQPGKPLKYSMVLFMDLSEPEGRVSPPSCMDALAEAAVSLSQGLLDAGVAHMLAWRESNGEIGRRPIADADSLTDILPRLLAGQESGASETDMRAANIFDSMSFSQLIWLCPGKPEVYFETDAKIFAISCVKNRAHSSADAFLTITPKTLKKDMASVII